MKDTAIAYELNLKDRLTSALSKVTASRELLDLAENSIRELLDILASHTNVRPALKYDRVSSLRNQVQPQKKNEGDLTELVSAYSPESPSCQTTDQSPNPQTARDSDSEAATSIMRGGCSWSPREMQVLAGIEAGWTNDQIATNLSVQPNYARRIRQRLYLKLGVHNTADALAKARKLGLLDSLSGTIEPAPGSTDSTGEYEHTVSGPADALQPEETGDLLPKQSVEQPEKIVALVNPTDGSFALSIDSGKNGLVCFCNKEAASLFAKYNQSVSGCIPIELDRGVAQQLAMSQDKTVSCLILLDDPSSPVILDL